MNFSYRYGIYVGSRQYPNTYMYRTDMNLYPDYNNTKRTNSIKNVTNIARKRDIAQ